MHEDPTERARAAGGTGEAAVGDALGAVIGAAGKRTAPPAEAYAQVCEAAHRAWQAKLRTRRRHRRYAAAAALAAAGAMAAMLAGLRPPSPPPLVASTTLVRGEVRVRAPGDGAWRRLDRGQPIVPGARLRSAPGGRLALRLTGGVSLRVDAASEITVAAARAIELLRGTIYVDSGAGAGAAPVVVTTEIGTVRDVGTQFEVAADAGALRVRVREGAVRVDAGGTGGGLVGAAGEQISLAADGAIERAAFAPFGPAWGWAETLAGAAEVEGRSLREFLGWVARETGRELRFDTPVTETRARAVTLHGDAAGLTPMRALEVMLTTTDFDYAIRGDGAILVSPRPR